MKKNIGKKDKTIRLTIALILAILFVTHSIAGTIGKIGLIIAAMLVLTSLINFCGLYSIFGINTCEIKK